MEVAVSQISGASFKVKVSETDTVTALKAAIAVQTKVAVTRQKLLFGPQLLDYSTPLSDLGVAGECPEVLMVVGSRCTLATHSHSPVGILDHDDERILRPVFVKDDDLQFQNTVEAMRLADGELYTLLRSGHLDRPYFCLQLWRGLPGTEACRYPLPASLLDESVSAQFTPEGDLVIAASMGEVFIWRTLTGEPYMRSDGSEWSGVPVSLTHGLMLIALNQGKRPIELWDYRGCVLKQSWPGQAGVSVRPRWMLSQSGRWLARWSCTTPMELCEVARPENERTITEQAVEQAAFSPDETEIIVVYRRDMYASVIRLSDGLIRHVVIPDGAMYFSEVGYSPDASVLFLSLAGGALYRWASASLELLSFTGEPTGDVMMSGLCRDDSTYFRSDREGNVDVIDLLTGVMKTFAAPES